MELSPVTMIQLPELFSIEQPIKHIAYAFSPIRISYLSLSSYVFSEKYLKKETYCLLYRSKDSRGSNKKRFVNQHSCDFNQDRVCVSDAPNSVKTAICPCNIFIDLCKDINNHCIFLFSTEKGGWGEKTIHIGGYAQQHKCKSPCICTQMDKGSDTRTRGLGFSWLAKHQR